ncbi:MAG: penicillin-binding protein 1A [Candidatus Thiodiazotropha sp. (ex Dulcina madagascariensis)]|nr:penicillin-binding protein 1A [Candidatus Thiodiazotropha sp. (ex Dulcina madagascariensis)]MCU7924810.1 penicillin-binding protein 1A [Candidatus Thiodiazotropha sp. (ex Dulcina madagascariensis)]
MKSFYRLLRYLVYFLFGLLLIGACGLYGAYLYLEPKLPSIETLKDVRLQVPLRIFSNDHLLIAEFGEKRREPLDYDEIPPVMIQAILAAEDDRFFQHPGVDYQGIIRAALQLLLTGERRQGGSTITMQVARNFFLSRKKTYTRKLNEILLALKIERMLSKEEILELYLNKIYLGHRAYGVGAAALVYYGRPVEKLELAEIAMIAGLPKAPSRHNPISDPARALIRRNYVLGRMHDLNYISQLEYDTAKAARITARLHTTPSEVEAPYVAEMARAEAVARFGQDAYTGGYAITTSVESHLQTEANRALRRAIQAYDKRHGYRGTAGHHDIGEITDQSTLIALLAEQPDVAAMKKAIVTAIGEQDAEVLTAQGESMTLDWPALSWASAYINHDLKQAEPKQTSEILAVGDLIYLYQETPEESEPLWRLAQAPEVSGALLSLSPWNGAIKALVGGYDFYLSKFNRVTQAKRQPGSGFKAFIYSAALEAGFTPASLINDAPVVFDDDTLEAVWRPENYSGRFFGPTRLRYALTHSRNLVSIRLLRKMGINHAVNYASRFGFDKHELPRDLSLALGSGAVTPLAMGGGYSVLANGGYYVSPHIITAIRDGQGKVLYEANPIQVCDDSMELQAKQAIDQADNDSSAQQENAGEGDAPPPPRCAKRAITEQNHYLMHSMLRDVIQHGTARKARSLGRLDIAGKTGTTNDQRDAWFNGFNHHLVTTTWIGFDDFKPLGRGEVGGRAALPAWIDYMRVALNGIEEVLPEMPPGMVTMRIDVDSGEPVGVGSPNAIFEIFEVINAPKLSNDRDSDDAQENAATTNTNPIEDPF